jgi:hypothetical protein
MYRTFFRKALITGDSLEKELDFSVCSNLITTTVKMMMDIRAKMAKNAL